MVGRDQRLMGASAGMACLATLLAALAGHTEVLAYAAPLLVLLLPLLAGRFVGEERIARAAARVRRARRPRPAVAAEPVTWLRGMTLIPRGGRLIARALAVRPPPAPASR